MRQVQVVVAVRKVREAVAGLDSSLCLSQVARHHVFSRDDLHLVFEDDSGNKLIENRRGERFHVRDDVSDAYAGAAGLPRYPVEECRMVYSHVRDTLAYYLSLGKATEIVAAAAETKAAKLEALAGELRGWSENSAKLAGDVGPFCGTATERTDAPYPIGPS